VLISLNVCDFFSDDPDECGDFNGKTHYIGMVHPDTNTSDSRGTVLGTAYMNDNVAWVKFEPHSFVPSDAPALLDTSATLAHELAHNLGRKHVDCGNPDDIDTGYLMGKGSRPAQTRNYPLLRKGVPLTSAVDGQVQGTGQERVVGGLGPGLHTIVLTAEDSAAQTATAESAIIVRFLRIPEADAPQLDGFCDDAAYLDTPQLQLAPYSSGGQATVRLVRSNAHLWACFSGLQPGAETPGAFAGLRFGVNYSRDDLAQLTELLALRLDECVFHCLEIRFRGEGGAADGVHLQGLRGDDPLVEHRVHRRILAVRVFLAACELNVGHFAVCYGDVTFVDAPFVHPARVGSMIRTILQLAEVHGIQRQTSGFLMLFGQLRPADPSGNAQTNHHDERNDPANHLTFLLSVNLN